MADCSASWKASEVTKVSGSYCHVASCLHLAEKPSEADQQVSLAVYLDASVMCLGSGRTGLG